MSSTLLKNLEDIATIKNSIKNSINAKGGALTTESFSTYPTAIDDLPSGGGGTPTEWTQEYYDGIYAESLAMSDVVIPIPDFVPGNDVIYYVVDILEGTDDTITLNSISGDYTVDWGDGSAPENFTAAAVNASHTYDFNNVNLSTNLTQEGYKEALITVTPQGGSSITSFSTYTSSGNIYKSCRALHINASGLTSLSLISTKNLKQFSLGENTITSFYSMFQGCDSLVSIPELNVSSGTNFENTFLGCHSLITIPEIDTSLGRLGNLTFGYCPSLKTVPVMNLSSFNLGRGLQSMFEGCYSLILLPQLNTNGVLDFSYMFEGCYSLTSISLLDTGSGTSFSSMFSNCYSLTNIPQINTGSGTSFSSMFSNCYSLTNIPQINTSSGTNFSYMFSGCSSLTTIPLLNTISGTNFIYMFQNCRSLTSIPQLDTSNVSSFIYMFLNANNLRRSQLLNTKSTISYQSCNLSRSALVEIFTNLFDLTSLTSQNINITSNPGSTLLIQAERDIALNKNWTITG